MKTLLEKLVYLSNTFCKEIREGNVENAHNIFILIKTLFGKMVYQKYLVTQENLITDNIDIFNNFVEDVRTFVYRMELMLPVNKTKKITMNYHKILNAVDKNVDYEKIKEWFLNKIQEARNSEKDKLMLFIDKKNNDSKHFMRIWDFVEKHFENDENTSVKVYDLEDDYDMFVFYNITNYPIILVEKLTTYEYNKGQMIDKHIVKGDYEKIANDIIADYQKELDTIDDILQQTTDTTNSNSINIPSDITIDSNIDTPDVSSTTTSDVSIVKIPNVSSTTTTDVSNVKIPDVSSITSNISNIKMPNVSNVKKPDVSNVSLPNVSNVKIPDVSNIKKPNVSNVKIPDVSNIKKPNVSNVKIPDVSNIKKPNVSNVKIPDVSNIKKPDFSNVKKTNVSGVKIPDTSSISISDVKIPDISISTSDIKMPNISISTSDIKVPDSISTPDVRGVNKQSGGKDKKVELIYYSARWCGFCKTFDPIWEELKNKNIKNVKFLKYDLDNDREKFANIKTFPTIKLKKQNKEYNFKEGRTINNLMDFVSQYL